MGKNRKHEDSEEKIRRKIRKLENKLKKRPRHTSYSSDSEPYNDIDPRSPSLQPTVMGDDTPNQWSRHNESVPQSVSPCSSVVEVTPVCDPMATTSGVAQHSIVPGISTENDITCAKDIQLAEDILQLLGDAPKAETALGAPIHKDVAHRWQKILVKSLEKEAKDKLIESYLVPSNRLVDPFWKKVLNGLFY
ncbi:hypothetical protein evm_013443 [Chilo suppressalis]|nr:hypothetical protein evm_013443 [Chilo suppressalis]